MIYGQPIYSITVSSIDKMKNKYAYFYKHKGSNLGQQKISWAQHHKISGY